MYADISSRFSRSMRRKKVKFHLFSKSKDNKQWACCGIVGHLKLLVKLADVFEEKMCLFRQQLPATRGITHFDGKNDLSCREMGKTVSQGINSSGIGIAVDCKAFRATNFSLSSFCHVGVGLKQKS